MKVDVVKKEGLKEGRLGGDSFAKQIKVSRWFISVQLTKKGYLKTEKEKKKMFGSACVSSDARECEGVDRKSRLVFRAAQCQCQICLYI